MLCGIGGICTRPPAVRWRMRRCMASPPFWEPGWEAAGEAGLEAGLEVEASKVRSARAGWAAWAAALPCSCALHIHTAR